jgi:hypothetical protein
LRLDQVVVRLREDGKNELVELTEVGSTIDHHPRSVSAALHPSEALFDSLEAVRAAAPADADAE